MKTTEDREHPQVSVVVASFSGEAALTQCLQSLVAQLAGVEVIVATNAAADVVSQLAARFPAAVFVRGPAEASVFQLRSLGLVQARGRLIALTEDHCTVAPDWIETLRAAHEGGHAIVGGPVDNGLCRRIYDWALFFCEYGTYMPPFPGGSTRVLSGVNVAYAREVLLGCRSTWQEAFYENEVHDVLRAAGYQLHLAEKACVRNHLRMSLWGAMVHLFGGGRRFGGYRKSQSRPVLRGLWVVLAPAVPFIHLSRISRRVVTRRAERVGTLVRSLPYLLCLLAAWTAGEALGYLTGLPVPRAAKQP